MDISYAIKTAQDAVTGADLPPGLQEVAFGEVLRHLLRGSDQPIPADAVHAGLIVDPADTSGLARLSARIGVSQAALADVFEVSREQVSLHIASSKINSAKSRATREIALLIASARQGSGADESWTAVSHIRDVLQQYNRYDPSNFSAYLRGAGDAFNFRGKGPSLEMRLTKPGWEMAGVLVRSLTGGA